MRPVLLRKTDKLLCLPEFAPWEDPRQQFLRKTAAMSSNLLCLADVVIAVSHRISCFVFGIIAVVGGSLAFGYYGMSFDHLPSIVDTCQFAVDAEVQICADIIV